MPETLLAEAERITTTSRNDDYGHPAEDFSRTAALWSAAFGWEVTPEQVSLAMILLKVSREVHRPKRDNRVDIAGYVNTLEMVHEFKAQSLE